MVLSFALWGVGDILSSGNSQLAAKIGNEKITLDEFYNEFQISVKNYNQNTQSNINLKDAFEMNLHNILLNEMIFTKMIANYAKNKNIFLNNEALKLIVMSMPQFHNDKGGFSEKKYKTYIFNNFINEENFLKEIEDTVFQGIVFENFKIDQFMNKKIVNLFYEHEGERRSIDYFILDKIEQDNDFSLVEQFYEKNKNDYKEKEKIIIDYIEINIEQFKQPQNISENQITEYYNSNISQYTETESRDIEFARFDNESDAKIFYEIFIQNDDEKLNGYINENKININTISNFKGNTFSEEINNKIFQLQKNEISKPIKYEDIGYYIFRINEINEENVLNLNTVKNEIREYLSLEEAYIDFDNSIDEADTMLLNNFNLNEISDNLQNVKIAKDINLEELIKKIDLEKNNILNTYPIGFISDLILRDNIAYIFTVKRKENSYIPQLSEIKERVVLDFEKNKNKELLLSKADKILIDLQFKEYNLFKNYADRTNLNIKSLNNIKRTNSIFNFETVSEIFKIKQGNYFKIELENGDIGIGVVTKISKPDSYISDNIFANVENNIISSFNSSIESIIGNDIIDSSSYEIYNQNIDKLFM